MKRRILSNLATVGAMAGVGLILISTTVPANAFVRPETASSAASSAPVAAKTQAMSVGEVVDPAITRDAYTVVSRATQVQAKFGNQSFAFTNNPTGTVQWPFAAGSPITSGFGPRNVAGCGFCSKYHLGLDMAPGAGTPIQSIADGVVSLVEVSNSGLGNRVIVDHVVNGQKVQSEFAHMKYGSIPVAVGQTIKVGDIVGAVGNTGASTGAHLHFQILLGGTPVDPFAWLKANAN